MGKGRVHELHPRNLVGCMGFKTRWPPRQQTREEGTLLPFHGSICGCPAEGAFPVLMERQHQDTEDAFSINGVFFIGKRDIRFDAMQHFYNSCCRSRMNPEAIFYFYFLNYLIHTAV